ncbi:MAG: hypothetical protein LBD11_03410 [Candidatus Peribacteria bacterium]|jgi:hypothetical protein|nr:hypothetical protein [Candidatus Peribacteria bacterium]
MKTKKIIEFVKTIFGNRVSDITPTSKELLKGKFPQLIFIAKEMWSTIQAVECIDVEFVCTISTKELPEISLLVDVIDEILPSKTDGKTLLGEKTVKLIFNKEGQLTLQRQFGGISVDFNNMSGELSTHYPQYVEICGYCKIPEGGVI